jgi:hypothetical protein
MKKQKRQIKIINFLGVLVGIIFILIALTSAPASDPNSYLILGLLLGLLFIFLSLTPLGDTDIQNPYVRLLLSPFIIITPYYPKKISWIYILCLLALSAIAVLEFAPALKQDLYGVINKFFLH